MNIPSDSASQQHRAAAKSSLRVSIMTVSDTRSLENDTSGQLLCDAMLAAGHRLLARTIVRDEVEEIRGQVISWVAGYDVPEAILVTGGTGISPRDKTPEAIEPLIEQNLPGFGELFRMLSYAEIGPAAMLSRSFAGRIGRTLVFCLPGSTAAVRLATEKLLVPELPHLVHHSMAQ